MMKDWMSSQRSTSLTLRTKIKRSCSTMRWDLASYQLELTHSPWYNWSETRWNGSKSWVSRVTIQKVCVVYHMSFRATFWWNVNFLPVVLHRRGISPRWVDFIRQRRYSKGCISRKCKEASSNRGYSKGGTIHAQQQRIELFTFVSEWRNDVCLNDSNSLCSALCITWSKYFISIPLPKRLI